MRFSCLTHAYLKKRAQITALMPLEKTTKKNCIENRPLKENVERKRESVRANE